MEHILLFSFFAISAIFSAILIIVSKNPIQSIFFLILSFINVAVLLFLLGLEFLPIAFIVVYVGAISVLFLFIVMMLNLRIIQIKDNSNTYIVIFFFIILLLFSILLSNRFVLNDFFLVNSNYCNNFLWFKEISLFIDNLLTDIKNLTIINNFLIEDKFKKEHIITEFHDITIEFFNNNREDTFYLYTASLDFYKKYTIVFIKYKEVIKFIIENQTALVEYLENNKQIIDIYTKLIIEQVNLDYLKGNCYGDNLLSPTIEYSDKLNQLISKANNDCIFSNYFKYAINKAYNDWLCNLLIEQIKGNPELARQSLLELAPELSESKINLIVNNPEKYNKYFSQNFSEEKLCEVYTLLDFFFNKLCLIIFQLELEGSKSVEDINLINNYKKLLLVYIDFAKLYLIMHPEFEILTAKIEVLMDKCDYKPISKQYSLYVLDFKNFFKNFFNKTIDNSIIKTTTTIDSFFSFKNFLKEKDSLGDIKIISQILYESKIIAFILSALILLVAMLGAIVLTLTIKRDKISVKRQEISNQVYRKIRFKIYENFRNIK